MNKAFVYRLHPSPAQEALLWQWIGAGRWVYNRCLERNTEQYKKDQTFLWYKKDLSPQLPKWAKEHPWLADPPAQALHQRMQDFDKALRRVKKGGKGFGFPRFRSRHIEHHQTLRFPHNQTKKKKGNITPTQRAVKLPKMPGPIPWTKHRPLEGRLKSVTVKRENNRWFAVCLCELEDVPFVPPSAEAEVLGIDPGLKSFAVTSDGQEIPTPRFYRNQEPKLRRAQRVVSRRKKGSRNREKAKRRLNRIHCRIKYQRHDFAHKQSTVIAKRARFLGVETLNIKGMQRNRHRAKSLADQAMGQFLSLLPYKVEARGGQMFKADRWFPSSKQCSRCRHVKPKLGLAERVYCCDRCGQSIDRDLNAAINLRMVAVEELRRCGHLRTPPLDRGENACGDTADGAGSHESASHVSPKQESVCHRGLRQAYQPVRCSSLPPRPDEARTPSAGNPPGGSR